jgi:hypothetical protein
MPIIAPYDGDVDTRGLGSNVVTYGPTTFDGMPALCANWVDVGYSPSQVSKLNSFQLLLVDRSDVAAGDFDIIFNYDRIEWESYGDDGLGGDAAHVGYSDGQTFALEFPGSGIPGTFLDTNPDGLIHHRKGSSILGRYVFAVRSGQPPEPTVTPTSTPTSTRTPTATATGQATATPSTAAGDANCSGGVDAVDAALVLQAVAALVGSLPCEGAADVNEDGDLSSIDAAVILQFVAGLIDGLPV